MLVSAVLYYGHNTAKSRALCAKHQDCSQPVSLRAGYAAQGGSQLCLCNVFVSLPSGCKLKQLHLFVCKRRDNPPHTLEIIPQFSYDTVSLQIYSKTHHLQFRYSRSANILSIMMRLLWGYHTTEEHPQASLPGGPQQTPHQDRASSAELCPCSQADPQCSQPLRQYIPLCSH